MPIYEYKCAACGAQSEKMQKVSDAPLIVCENCGGKLEKQWSLSGFQFKGEGWYVTDYAGKKAEKSGKGEQTEKSDKTEKTSVAESTASADSASNTSSESSTAAKKEAVSKKD